MRVSTIFVTTLFVTITLSGCDREASAAKPASASTPSRPSVGFATVLDLRSGARTLDGATHLAIDGQGVFHVLDDAEPKKTLHRFRPDGATAGTAGPLRYGINSYNFFFPSRIACDQAGNLYVCDIGFYWVRQFPAEGTQVFDYAGRGIEGSPILEPMNFAIDPAGHVHVTGRSGVHEYDNQGQLLRSWKAQGSGDGEYEQIDQLAIDGDGRLFILDADPTTVHCYDADRNHVKSWPGKKDSYFMALHDGQVYLAGSFHVAQYDASTGEELAVWETDEDQPEFWTSALTAGPDAVYLLDSQNLRVLRVTDRRRDR